MAEFVAGADIDADFEFVVEHARWCEGGCAVAAALLALRPYHRHAAGHDRAGAAVIGHRQMLERRRDRRIGPQHTGGAGDVIDRGEEVGETADIGRYFHRGAVHRHQQIAFMFLGTSACAQQIGQFAAQTGDVRRRHGHKGIECGKGCRFRHFSCCRREQPCFKCRLDVENHVADGDAAARIAARCSEYAERQILDGEVCVRRVCRFDPALAGRIVGLVQRCHFNS